MLVSCILATHVKNAMLRDALVCYTQQDWQEKELIVVDDSPEPSRDWCEELIPANELNYIHLGTRAKNLSTKRNIAARNADGEYIVHLDSDDWSAPDRVRHQVEALSKARVMVGGYHTAMFWDEILQQASCYHGQPNYAWGATLCYRREYALVYPWPEHVAFAEDNDFIRRAQQEKSISPIDGTGKMVVRMHHGNSRRKTGSAEWPNIPTSALPQGFLAVIGLTHELFTTS